MVAAIAVAAISVSSCTKGSWRTASRDSAGLAPLPKEESAAVVQVYAARVWGWRGIFADHTWVSVKRENADSYTVYEVVGWQRYQGKPVRRIATDVPDRRWYGAEPKILYELRGEAAQQAAGKIHEAAMNYPYPNRYLAYPGPNSNTFTQWIIQSVPELNFRLPARAVGKGYI